MKAAEQHNNSQTAKQWQSNMKVADCMAVAIEHINGQLHGSGNATLTKAQQYNSCHAAQQWQYSATLAKPHNSGETAL